MSSCFRMPVAPGTSSCRAMCVSSVTLMSFSVVSSTTGASVVAAAPAGSVTRAAATSLAIVAIIVHSASNPSPLVTDTGTAAIPNTFSMVLRLRARSARDSLSILVATTCRVTFKPSSQRAAAMSVSSPGCRESTSSITARLMPGSAARKYPRR